MASTTPSLEDGSTTDRRHCRRGHVSMPCFRRSVILAVLFLYAPTDAFRLMTAHRSFSALSYAPDRYATESFTVLIPFLSTSESKRAAHTARALKVLETHTKLLAIPCTLENHSVLQLSSAAHFAALHISAIRNLRLCDRELDIGCERLRLTIRFFNSMGNYWPLGKTAAM